MSVFDVYQLALIFQDFVVRDKDAEEHFAGYETVDFGSSTTTEENVNIPI